MNEKLKEILEDVFKYQCFTISEGGGPTTLCFIIKGYDLMPILLQKDVEMDAKQYISFALNIAHENDADSMILLGEQFVVSGDIDSESIKYLLSGEVKASEHPDRKPNLVLTYMKANGESDMLFGEIKTTITGTRYISAQQWSHNAKTSALIPWR